VPKTVPRQASFNPKILKIKRIPKNQLSKNQSIGTSVPLSQHREKYSEKFRGTLHPRISKSAR
jgi:hypothetical protein